MIRLCPGVVNVFVVTIDLEVFAQRPKATCKQSGIAPLGVLALVGELGSSVRAWMVGANRQAPLGCNAIAMRPVKSGSRPIEIETVPVSDESIAGKRNMEQDDGL